VAVRLAILLAAACGSGAGSGPPPAAVVEVRPAESSVPIELVDASTPPAPVSAPSAPPKEDTTRARALFVEGRQAYDRADYATALDRFQGAYAAAPRPQILYDISVTLERLGRYAEAADALERYIREDTTMSQPERAKINLRIKTLRAHP
jgi:tetratricopeptide (TPR) repeat protein